MIIASKLAGFFAAHAIWCVSDGETLIPMFAYVTEDEGNKMERLIVGDDLEASVAYGKQKLATNEANANDAVLLYDARIAVGEQSVDAIIIELRSYFSPKSEVILAVPYTPKAAGEFRVHKPKLLVWNNCDDFDMNASLQAFFEGVDEHEKGAEIWNACLDESR